MYRGVTAGESWEHHNACRKLLWLRGRGCDDSDAGWRGGCCIFSCRWRGEAVGWRHPDFEALLAGLPGWNRGSTQPASRRDTGAC